ncbi:MAG: hypothetical protein JWN04_1469, partial [Myxococcaceae bacterium]|nr:hypothetical protein [Myxococcaceae bacterium]
MSSAMRSKLFVAACMLWTYAGCAWFEPSTHCTAGATSCDGRHVRTCGLDASASSSGQPKLGWQTTATCGDDTQLGPSTCGLVLGHATCVPAATADASVGASAATAVAEEWLRVSITRDGDAFGISDVESFSLSTLPTDPAWGVIAAVAYQGAMIVDATLVPWEASSLNTFAWLRGAQVDRVELMASDGTGLATVSQAPPPAAAKSQLASITSALTTNIPDTLKTTATIDGFVIPETDAMLQMLDSALALVPPELLVLAQEVVFALDAASARSLQTLPPPGSPDAGASALAREQENLPFPGARHAARSDLSTGRLWLDFSSSALRDYAQGTSGLSFDIISALGQSFGGAAQTVSEVQTLGKYGLKLSADFPSSVSTFLSDTLAPLLQTGETPFSAWALLHGVAAEAGLASPYGVASIVTGAAPLAPPADDATAVQQGFAAADGASDASADLLSYLARANVLELWIASPCDA